MLFAGSKTFYHVTSTKLVIFWRSCDSRIKSIYRNVTAANFSYSYVYKNTERNTVKKVSVIFNMKWLENITE